MCSIIKILYQLLKCPKRFISTHLCDLHEPVIKIECASAVGKMEPPDSNSDHGSFRTK